jgi:hypothetical protein
MMNDETGILSSLNRPEEFSAEINQEAKKIIAFAGSEFLSYSCEDQNEIILKKPGMQQRLYSKQAIGLLALLLSPFLASVLFAYNLKETGKGKIGPLFILGALFFTGIITQLTTHLDWFYRMSIVNVAGSLLLTFLWDQYFSGYSYKKKNFWKPTLFFIGVMIVLFLLQLFFSGK